jgi:uncharacterized protein YciI
MQKLAGANMDIDLTSSDKVAWLQAKCPWNEAERTDSHRCAVKNTSLCRYFRGVAALDQVLCDYPAAPEPENFTRYVVLLTMVPGRKLTPDLIRAHVQNLERLDEEGRLVLCGPMAGTPSGMAIIKAASLEEAQAIAAADPFVASGAETCQVLRLDLSCRENNHMGYGS